MPIHTPQTYSTTFAALVREYNERQYERRGAPPGAFVRTFGCQQNVSDSEKIKGMLAQMGYLLLDSPENADLVLFNTCAIRENAEDRIFGNVGALKHAKARNKHMIIGLCGCMMQQEHIPARIRKHYPYVDLVFGTHALPRLPELIYRKLREGGRVFEVGQSRGAIVEDLPTRRDGTVKAWVPVMYGCDNYCAYCVVPYVRGRERSREKTNIVDEVRGLLEQGYREFTLLGQNVNSYGKTLDKPVSFARLLDELASLPGKFRLRFMTSHPKDCTRELIDTIAAHENICNHIHLPVQSGSNRVLAAMNRRYTREHYLGLLDYAREKIPDVAFTSDIIVGFPGETEQDFLDTLSLIERVRYQSLFTFLYSRRIGTKAAELPDNADDGEKMNRFDRLLDAQREIGEAHLGSLLSRTVEVLVEGSGKTAPGRMTGRTPQGVIVEFEGGKDLVGQFVRVRVAKALPWAVVGDLQLPA